LKSAQGLESDGLTPRLHEQFGDAYDKARIVKPARRLRQETTMTLQWMADRLKMGTWIHVANRLYHLKK
jgi:hypothetical protein